jgi:hypothetical protein
MEPPPRPNVPPPPPASAFAGTLAVTDFLLKVGGVVAGMLLLVSAAVTGPNAWRDLWRVWASYGCLVLAAALLAARRVLEVRAGLRVSRDERFRWIDDPRAEAAHEVEVARRFPPVGRALRPTAYALAVVAWILLT